MTKPREKTREELTAEIEDGKKKIRQLENWEKVLRQKLSIVNNSTHFDISKSTLALCCVLSAARVFSVSGDFEQHIRCPVRRTHLCISWNRTIISQTAKDHAKPRTSGTTPRIAERCNPYAQTADTSRIRQALIFPP